MGIWALEASEGCRFRTRLEQGSVREGEGGVSAESRRLEQEWEAVLWLTVKGQGLWPVAKRIRYFQKLSRHLPN